MNQCSGTTLHVLSGKASIGSYSIFMISPYSPYMFAPRVPGGPTSKSWTAICCATRGGSSTTTPRRFTHLWWLKTFVKEPSTCCRCVCVGVWGGFIAPFTIDLFNTYFFMGCCSLINMNMFLIFTHLYSLYKICKSVLSKLNFLCFSVSIGQRLLWTSQPKTGLFCPFFFFLAFYLVHVSL